jgi:uncharacterized Zn-binding protein involved in type VI secretion
MPPAARETDIHVCFLPLHQGGPIQPPCEPTVLIGGLAAARVTDIAMCVGVGAPDPIAAGSPTVQIGGQNAARLFDPTDHGGLITEPGCLTVLIGDMGSADQTEAMSNAKKTAAGLVEQCGANGL